MVVQLLPAIPGNFWWELDPYWNKKTKNRGAAGAPASRAELATVHIFMERFLKAMMDDHRTMLQSRKDDGTAGLHEKAIYQSDREGNEALFDQTIKRHFREQADRVGLTLICGDRRSSRDGLKVDARIDLATRASQSRWMSVEVTHRKFEPDKLQFDCSKAALRTWKKDKSGVKFYRGYAAGREGATFAGGVVLHVWNDVSGAVRDFEEGRWRPNGLWTHVLIHPVLLFLCAYGTEAKFDSVACWCLYPRTPGSQPTFDLERLPFQ